MLSKFKRSKHQQHLAQLPKLPQTVADVRTLYTPSDYRATLLDLIAHATKRIYLVALYLEHDDAGRDILNALYQAKQRCPELEVCILVDWHRAQRGRIGAAAANTNADWYCAMADQHPGLPVCGSDGLNMNGKNGLACITPVSSLRKGNNKIVIRPLPGLPVVRDLVVDMGQFYTQYEKIKPYLQNDGKNPPAREHLQSPEQRAKLDGLYECILCACCSTSCPSFWWNPDKFIGPAGLLAAYRFLIDSRDTETEERLDDLDDAFSVFRCHSIMSCVSVCPKGLNPTRAIGHIKSMLLQRGA